MEGVSDLASGAEQIELLPFPANGLEQDVAHSEADGNFVGHRPPGTALIDFDDLVLVLMEQVFVKVSLPLVRGGFFALGKVVDGGLQ